MAINRTCDGRTRRDFLRVGSLTATGFTLASYLRLAEAGEVNSAKAKAAIFIDLNGGPSHLDSFDLKPEAPEGIRGTFKPIATNVPGIQISEHLPRLAKCADKYTILRGIMPYVGRASFGQRVCEHRQPAARFA